MMLPRPSPMKPTRPHWWSRFFSDEAFNAKANKVDEPTSGQNKAEANESDAVIMPAKVDEADAVDAT